MVLIPVTAVTMRNQHHEDQKEPSQKRNFQTPGSCTSWSPEYFCYVTWAKQCIKENSCTSFIAQLMLLVGRKTKVPMHCSSHDINSTNTNLSPCNHEMMWTFIDSQLVQVAFRCLNIKSQATPSRVGPRYKVARWIKTKTSGREAVLSKVLR